MIWTRYIWKTAKCIQQHEIIYKINGLTFCPDTWTTSLMAFKLLSFIILSLYEQLLFSIEHHKLRWFSVMKTNTNTFLHHCWNSIILQYGNESLIIIIETRKLCLLYQRTKTSYDDYYSEMIENIVRIRTMIIHNLSQTRSLFNLPI